MPDESDAVKETAKAVQEVAKLGSKVVDAANSAAPFVNRVLGRPLEDATGLLLGDPLRAARVLAQDWLARRVNQKIRERKLREDELAAVPPNIAILIFEAAQDESRDELQELWATLLSNAMDPERKSRVRIEFVETIRQLNPLDAVVLSSIGKTASMQPSSREYLITRFGLDRDEVVVSALHLVKLGCIEVSTTDRANYGLLSYGKLLLGACEGP